MELIGRKTLGFLKNPASSATEGTAMGARARADILAILAGNTRHLYEAIKGARVTVSGHTSEACAPPSPTAWRVPGHTHSGGADGEPIRRNLVTLIYGCESTSTTIDGGLAPSAQVSTTVRTATVINSPISVMLIPWGGNGTVYRSATLKVRLHASAGCSATIDYTSPIGGQSKTSTLGTGRQTITVGTVPLAPGIMQAGNIKITINWTAGTPTVSVLSVSFLR